MPDERETTFVIADDEFHRQLDLLRRTRRFLLAEGVQAIRSPDGESPFSLGGLNLVRAPVIRFFGSGKGATLEQWSYLEKKQDALQSYFSTDLQHRFRLQATQRVIISMPILLLLTAFLALALGVFAESFDASASAQAGWRFVAFLAWTSCLGGLGAIGFIAVNSLAIQDDATFDISNKSLVVMRIVLGGLFGCIVRCHSASLSLTSLPFGYSAEGSWIPRGGCFC